MKRVRTIVIVVGLLALGGLAVYFAQPGELTYQGKKLSELLETHSEPGNGLMLPSVFDADYWDRRAAVKAIGTNAIPTLLKWISATDSPLKDRLNASLERQHFIHFRFYTAADRHNMARRGFEWLGNDGLPAVPALTELLRDPDKNVRIRALDCLFSIDHDKKERLPILFQSLQSSNDDILAPVAFYIKSTYSDLAEAAGVYKLFPKWKNSTTNAVSINVPWRR